VASKRSGWWIAGGQVGGLQEGWWDSLLRLKTGERLKGWTVENGLQTGGLMVGWKAGWMAGRLEN
jgi:hypothetical protein